MVTVADKLKSRKLWILLGLIILVAVMNYLGKVNSSDFVDFLKWGFGLYSASNVASKFGVATLNKQL